MPFTVHISNFQSIRQAVVEVDGFTVITGRNNSGKTAVLRAIAGVFTNPPAGALIRHGESELSVEIHFGDGNQVRWQKDRNGKAVYTVNGKHIENVGRSVPQEVLDLGVAPVQAGTSKVWPQVAPQFTGQVFLLDLPGSALAEAIADVERVGKLNRSLKAAESDQRTSNSTLTLRRKDLAVCEQRIKDFEGLARVESEVGRLGAVEAEKDKAEEDLQDLLRLRAKRTALRTEVAFLEGIHKVHVPDLTESKEALEGLHGLRGIRERLAGTQALVAKLDSAPWETLEALPSDGPPRKALELLVSFGRLKKTRDALLVLVQGGDVSKVAGSLESLPLKEAIATWETAGTLRELLRRREQLLSEIAALSDEKSQQDQELVAVNHAVMGLLGSMGSCPLCGQEVA